MLWSSLPFWKYRSSNTVVAVTVEEAAVVVIGVQPLVVETLSLF